MMVRRWSRLRIARTYAVALCLASACLIAIDLSGIAPEAIAQAQTNIPNPSQNAPILAPGLRGKTPFGEVEIRTFTRSLTEQGTQFTVEYLVINEGSKDINYPFTDYVRLIADGIRRAPELGCCATNITVRPDSAEYLTAPFTVRGRPSVVILQFGTSADGHIYMRWPD
jgi:hypothetical protein